MRAFIKLLMVVGLAGCATNAQRVHDELANNLKTAGVQSETCFNAVNQSAPARMVESKFPADATKATLAQMAITTYPDDDDVKALFSLHEEISKCRRLILDALDPRLTEFQLALVTGYTKSDQVFSALVKKEMTWGDANLRRKAISSDMEAALNQADKQVTEQLNNAHNAEIRQRMMAAQAIEQYNYQQQMINYQQQMINALNRPTTCSAWSSGRYTTATCR